MNTDVGIEMTPEESRTNCAACLTAIRALPKYSSIDEVVELVADLDPEINPNIIRKFLSDATDLGLT